jgi:hypothetical protein
LIRRSSSFSIFGGHHSSFTRCNGLALKGANTQLMIGGAKDKDISNVVVVVDNAEIKPGNTLELIGVTFDQKITVRPSLAKLTKEARFRTGRVAPLAQHPP